MEHDKLLQGDIAVITAAGAGIGAETARLFHEHGATVYVTDIDAAAAEAVAKELGERAIPMEVDVRREDHVVALHDRVIAEQGRLDILVNNAGHWVAIHSLERGGPEHWQALYEINLLHVFRVTHAFLPGMIEQKRGAIINVSSIEGVRGYPVDPVYGAFKAAVVHFTKCLGVDVALHGVRVNGIAPDLTNTDQSNFAEWDSPEVAERWHQYLPVGRVGEPIDQARTVLFLASEQSSFLVGQTLNTDGGTAAAAGWFRSARRPGRSWTNRPFEP
jgi:NAD(P)-dependent dehydrogenase (short-subunit alcohol dehydrogenase family)